MQIQFKNFSEKSVKISNISWTNINVINVKYFCRCNYKIHVLNIIINESVNANYW